MLRISLLGEQSIVDEATGATRSRSVRSLALIAFLAVHPGVPQPRQRIASLFWPDSAEAQALTNLRRELHNLRNALGGEPCVAVTSRDLCWRDDGALRVDVRLFDREHRAAVRDETAGDLVGAAAHADAALAEYRGDLLPGAFDDWVLEARAELQDRAVRLCALLSGVRVRLGRPAAALDAAAMRIRLRPLEETGYRVLMRLQADLGDRAAALATYHRCASLLERELGVEPDEATRAVLARLLARSPSRPPVVPAAAVPFVGRTREAHLLREAWRSASAGRPGVVLVRGGAGVGKTRLVGEFATASRAAGAVTATAQCFATSGRLALAPVAEWLRSPEIRPAVAGLEPVWRDEVDRLVPAADRRQPGGRSLEAWQQHRFYEGLARALLAVRRPLLLVLDDVQWCDHETLTFLTFCLRLAPDAPVLVAATLRDGSGHPGPDGWIADLRSAGALTELALGPLPDDDAARLAETVRGGPLPDADRVLLAAVTGGFPLHVVEAMRAAGRAPLPFGDLAAVLDSRLAQASPATQEVAGLAAAVGCDFSLDLLTTAAGQDPDTVVQAVDELWRLRILREGGRGYDFSHDLLRDAAYERVSPPRRWLLHRRVAEGLEALHGDDTGPVAAHLAEQYARGGQPERAFVHYRQAAAVATGVFAHAEAVRLHEAALAIVRSRPAGPARDRDELALLEAMAAPLNAGRGYADAELQGVLERSVALAESLGRTASLVAALVGLWSSRFVQGRVTDSHEVAERALVLGEVGEPGGVAHFAYAGSALTRGRPGQALDHFATAAALAPGVLISTGNRTDVHGRAWVAHAHWLRGDDGAAQACAQEAIDLARSQDRPYGVAVALAYAAVTRQLRGDREELRRTVRELRELCGRYGFGYYREWGVVLDGWSRGGPHGIALAREGIRTLVADGAVVRRPYWLTLLADLLAEAGDRDGARDALDDAAADALVRGELWWLPEVLRMRAAHDRPVDAVARLREAAGLAEQQGSVALRRRCERDLAAFGTVPATP